MASRQYDSLPRHKARLRQAARERKVARRRQRNSENGGDLRLWGLAAVLFAAAFLIIAQTMEPRTVDNAVPTIYTGSTPFFLPATANPQIAALNTPIPQTIDPASIINVTMRAGSGLQAPEGGINAPLSGLAPTSLPVLGGTVLTGSNSGSLAGLPRPIPPTPIPVSSGFQLNAYCNFDTPVSVSIFDWETGSTTVLSSDWIAALPLSWDARSNIWRGYSAAKPFDEPDDMRIMWRVSLFNNAGAEQFIDIGTSPTMPNLYVYAFDNIVPFADRNGRHYGMHPCRAFSMTPDHLTYLMEAARSYQEFSGAYPALIQPDDPRWQRGVVTPIEDSLNVRAIPMQFNNNPIHVITAPVEVWYAVDPREWREWAQIKIGNVQGWVNTGYARFAAS